MTHPLRDLIFSLFGRHVQRSAAVAVLAVGRRPGIQKALQGAGTATGGSGVEGTALVAVHVLLHNGNLVWWISIIIKFMNFQVAVDLDSKSRECDNDVQASSFDIIIDPTYPPTHQSHRNGGRP